MTLLGPLSLAPVSISSRLVRGTTYVVLSGSFGPDQAVPTERALVWAGETAPHALVVDLVGVIDLDESCAAALERVLGDLQARLGPVPVVARDHRLVDALARSGITVRHRVVPSLSAALAVLGGYEGHLG